MTISTHNGLFSYTRIPYGTKSAPSIFQNIMGQLFCNIQGVVCCLDDILITGKDDKEHLLRLESVLERLHNCGLKLKKEKCAFFQNSVKYLGHTIDKSGLHTSQDKVEAIKSMPTPTTITELK